MLCLRYTKNYSLFFWDSNLTGCSVSYPATLVEDRIEKLLFSFFFGLFCSLALFSVISCCIWRGQAVLQKMNWIDGLSIKCLLLFEYSLFLIYKGGMIVTPTIQVCILLRLNKSINLTDLEKCKYIRIAPNVNYYPLSSILVCSLFFTF